LAASAICEAGLSGTFFSSMRLQAAILFFLFIGSRPPVCHQSVG
jgi:hypothetical protein